LLLSSLGGIGHNKERGIVSARRIYEEDRTYFNIPGCGAAFGFRPILVGVERIRSKHAADAEDTWHTGHARLTANTRNTWLAAETGNTWHSRQPGNARPVADEPIESGWNEPKGLNRSKQEKQKEPAEEVDQPHRHHDQSKFAFAERSDSHNATPVSKYRPSLSCLAGADSFCTGATYQDAVAA
jgi:hypothetical protein